MTRIPRIGDCALRSGSGGIAGVRNLSEKDLGQHLKLIQASNEQDRDELLRDLLVHVYPTKQSQDD
jgi:hypothetical protein